MPGEFDLIEWIRKRVERNSLLCRTNGIVAGIGDDSAVIGNFKGKLLLATTDMMVENVHFTKEIGYESVGYKAMVSSISDIICMGGKPKYALISLGLRERRVENIVDQFYRGILRSGRKFGVAVVGGDIVRSPLGCVVSVGLLGEIEKDSVVYRSGAKVGDMILVTGSFGDASAGWEIISGRWRLQTSTDYAKRCKKYLVRRHILPEPRMREAEIISQRKLATSMIDCSDGLDLSIRFICQASKVGARVLLDKIPISACLRYLLQEKDEKPLWQRASLRLALYGGEDYELVFTVRKDKVDEVLRYVPIATPIGEIIPGRGEVKYLNEKGKEVKLHGAGYEHFVSSSNRRLL